MKNNGTTIILVTHDMSTIDRLCDYAIWLEHGKIIADGSPKKIENKYLKFMAEEQEERKKIEIGKNINKQNDLRDNIQDEDNKIKICSIRYNKRRNESSKYCLRILNT